MIRHVFVAPVKDGVTDELLNAKMEEMRRLEDAVAGIEGFALGRSLGLAGPSDAVTMVIDFVDEDAFEALMASELHCKIGAEAAEAFKVEEFAISQIEI